MTNPKVTLKYRPLESIASELDPNFATKFNSLNPEMRDSLTHQALVELNDDWHEGLMISMQRVNNSFEMTSDAIWEIDIDKDSDIQQIKSRIRQAYEAAQAAQARLLIESVQKAAE